MARLDGWRFVCGWLLLVLACGVLPVARESVAAGDWLRLESDGLHDPAGPAIGELQQPGDALAPFEKDVVGNKVRWVQALRLGQIKPRTNLLPKTEVNLLDMDIIFGKTGDNAFVRFPHLVHTEWLDCANCHEEIFKKEFGKTPISMLEILGGKYCGKCHGAVAFPLTECNRCHSVNPSTFRGKFGVQKR